MYFRTLLSYALAFGIFPIASLSVVSLDGNSWTLTNPAKNISVPASVPGSVHLDLQRAEVIGDPYYGLNEVNLRWVLEDYWIYSSPVTAMLNNLAANESVFLIFDGLDTVASIDVCGKNIAVTNNQFRQYTFDVSSVLQRCPHNGTIDVEFTPGTLAASKAARSANCKTCFGINYEFPDIEYIRKQQADFGWDFGPAYGPIGIWQPVRAVQLAQGDIYVENSAIDIYREGQVNNLPPDQSQPWIVDVSVDYLGKLAPGAVIQVKIEGLDGKTVTESTLSDLTTNTPGRISGQMIVTEPVDLWWPTGYGPQTLYNLTIQIQDCDKKVLASLHKRTGFRTIVLDQRTISNSEIALGVTPGSKWNFEINGHEIWCKGSNMVPPDAFWTRVTQERIRDMFTSVVDGNQNMVRVWGGGAYLPDWAYDLADEMGIMLWTDFQFSDAMGPVDDDFLANVKTEATYQVRRINHHPSLAVWVGNNEIELGLPLISLISESEAAAVKTAYEKLFLDVLIHVVFENTRSISYSPSSITNGYLSFNISSPTPMVERYFNVTAGTISGNTDYYKYDASQAFNNSAYPVGRFATEFGFHSMPSLQSWEKVLPPSDLYFNSSVILSRSHHYPVDISSLLSPVTNQTKASLGGMGQMTLAGEAYYPVPPTDTTSLANFSSWIYTSQVFQSDFYRNQISFYRTGSGRPERTLGALYWQLNEMWQTPSWAGLEHDGRWKMVHYIAKDVFEPVIIAPQFDQDTGDLTVWAVSDLWSTAKGHASIMWYDWTGKVLSTSNSSVSIGAINATKAFGFNVHDIGLDLSNAIAKCSVEVQGVAPNSKSGNPTTYKHETWFHAKPLAKQASINPKLSIRHDQASSTFFVRADGGVAAWVWLDHPAGVSGNFEDNGFWLLPGHDKSVGFKVKKDSTNGKWVHSVTVRSLWDNTQ